ncbi:hypothetical protein RJ639_009612, partial [Escallonia herrerae]
MEYRNKLVLAPMVRVGTLPFRLLAAEYGADITYGEEIIDHKLLKCERRVNDVIGSIDVVEKGTENVVFRTCHQESSRVVFQMGTSNAVRALTAAQIVCKDVAGVDINMGGRPNINNIEEEFGHTNNLHGRWKEIGKRGLELGTMTGDHLGFLRVAIHARKVADRPRDPAKWSEIADVVTALSIPVIANGDIFEHEDFERIKAATGASSVMVARGALWNASVFSPKGKRPLEAVKGEYVRKSILWDNDIKSTKHTLKEMIVHHSSLELPEGKAVIKSETLADI